MRSDFLCFCLSTFSTGLEEVPMTLESCKEMGIKHCWNWHYLLSHIRTFSWSHDNDCQHNCSYCRNPPSFVFMTNIEHIDTQRCLVRCPHILNMPKLSFSSFIFTLYLQQTTDMQGLFAHQWEFWRHLPRGQNKCSNTSRNGGLCSKQMKVWK